MMQWAADMKAAGTIKNIIVLINTSNALQVDFLKNNDYNVDAVVWIGGVGISADDRQDRQRRADRPDGQ